MEDEFGNLYAEEEHIESHQISALLYSNEERYKGEFADFIINGTGIFSYNDRSRYEGDWENGERVGKGIMFYNDEARCEGE